MNGRIAGSNGDKVYAKGPVNNEFARYEIIRRGKKITDPTTGQLLGVMGFKVADAQLLEFNRGMVSLRIMNAKRPVKKGDRLLLEETYVPENVFLPKSPTEAVVGKVVSIVSGLKRAGKYDSIIISLGRQQNMRPGDILVVKEAPSAQDPLTGKRIHLPPRHVGVVMIYRPFDSLSYGIIMSTSEDIQVGDYLTNP